MKNSDLHTHSYYSDGQISPKELVRLAKKRKIKNLALTDHNSVKGVEEAIREGKKIGVNIIPAVEIRINRGEILGYFIDYRNKKFQNELKKNSEITWRNKTKLRIKGFEKLGINISEKLLRRKYPKSNLESIHLSMYLQEEGYTDKEIDGLFDRIKTKSIYRKIMSAINAIRLIKNVGGVPVFSHPWLSKKLFTEKNIKRYAKEGLKGIELDNGDKSRWGRDKKFARKIKKFAKKYNLILTLGTDYHGWKFIKGKGHQLGSTLCDEKVVEQLRVLSSLQ